ncbi:MAG: bifunctional folylpolyglutamate synthase/dihydrofolate synthase [Clostridia bacterium]|nr:bifunctional folylpolyglutamate synthase/dihydrofolate synthase [Clostridia bacterium]
MSKKKMNVEEYLSNFFKGTKNPTLNAMKYFMEEFAHPEKDLKIIHIAGTNGKGSCTEMITNILINAGYKVGKFISPHLIKYNERISIQNTNITNEKMEEIIEKIKPKIDKYNSLNNSQVTLFELETTMAILYFYENNCDFVVLETGLGGLYDCTNIVNPIVSIITSIGYDHTNILGNTLVEIATQKAGIIKENSDTIFALSDEKEVNEVIKQKCAEKNNKLHEVKKEDIKNYTYNQEFQEFDYKNYKNILINLKGEKQLLNSSICIECVEILRNKLYNVSEESLRKGLKTVIHKGRFEKINEKPIMIFDGAHNKPAMENFCKSRDMYYKKQNKVYIISILRTKDYKMILKELLKDEKSTFIFTSGNNEEIYVPKETLLETAKKYTNNSKLNAQDLEETIDFVKENYINDVIFFVGSFYIYGTVIEKLKKI